MNYDTWKDALKGKNPALPNGRAMPGFWRMRETRGGPFIGVAIWPQGDMLGMQIGREAPRICDADFQEAKFPFAFKNPISEQLYRDWFDSGQWADAPPAPDPMADDSNRAGETDPLRLLLLDIDAEDLELKRFLKTPITDQTAADKATNWSNRLQAMMKRRDEGFEDEKKPLREAGRQVDERWREPKQKIDRLREDLRLAQKPFLLEKARLENERAAAEAKARQAAFQAGQPVQKPVETAPVKSGSTGGRRTRVVDVVTGVIENMDDCIAALRTHPEFIACVQHLADRAAQANIELPGVRRHVDKDVKQ